MMGTNGIEELNQSRKSLSTRCFFKVDIISVFLSGGNGRYVRSYSRPGGSATQCAFSIITHQNNPKKTC